MLRPLEPSLFPVAIDLLCEGFPKHDREYWERCFDVLDRFGGNRAAGIPLGSLLQSPGGDFGGVILTPASLRSNGRRMVNFCSWYVRPAHRAQGFFMLRKLLADTSCIYTDLTPTESVQKLLPALGFTLVSPGVCLALTPLLALGLPLTEVRAISDLRAADFEDGVHTMLLQHEAFGCRAVAFREGNDWIPVAFKFRRTRGLPAAVLVYCGQNRYLERHLPSLARFLLLRGRCLAVLDLPLEGPARGIAYPGKMPRFLKGEFVAHSTDYCGTELALFS